MALYALSAGGADAASETAIFKEIVMIVIPSKNRDWGFYGTTRRNRNFSVRKEWANAFQWVAKAVPCWSPEHIRDFLDSRCGRHLADEACECGGIANVNPERWMNEFLGFGDENDLGQLMAAFRCKVYAQKALKEAEINLRKAESFLNEFLSNLSKANSGCAYDNGMIEYANGKLEMIKVYFGE